MERCSGHDQLMLAGSVLTLIPLLEVEVSSASSWTVTWMSKQLSPEGELKILLLSFLRLLLLAFFIRWFAAV